jgi:Mg2+/Co2+ transporter CorB
MPRPPIKRAAAIGIINIGANLPNVYMPYLFNGDVSPHFYAGFGVCVAFLVINISMIVIIRLYLAHLNKKLDRGISVDGFDPAEKFRFTY